MIIYLKVFVILPKKKKKKKRYSKAQRISKWARGLFSLVHLKLQQKHKVTNAIESLSCSCRRYAGLLLGLNF